ncbi:hypothetical protein DRQ26_06640 [bacterium]|nr:MAG: hypothetical protein DRQ26_06640 [bacterium]
MKGNFKIFIIFSIVFCFVFVGAQTNKVSADSSRKSKSKSAEVSESNGEDEDIIGGFLRSLFGEGDSEKSSDSSEKYDYFKDKDGDGVDDRLNIKKSRTKSKKTTYRTKKSSSTSGKNSTTTGTKSTRRRGQ